jgi:hypothetical protein
MQATIRYLAIVSDDPERLDRPDARDYYRIWDPDGNHFDLRVAGAWSGGA